MKKNLLTVGTAVATLSLLLVATPATADPLEPSTTYLPMYVVDYDEAVANANGFEIQTLEDGSRVSVPVTPEAITLFEAADAELVPVGGDDEVGEVSPMGYASVEGPCGTSEISLTQSGSNNVFAQTGYDVRLAVNYRAWSVTLYGVTGIGNYPMNGGAGGKSWSTAQNLGFPHGGAGGWGHVPPGSTSSSSMEQSATRAHLGPASS